MLSLGKDESSSNDASEDSTTIVTRNAAHANSKHDQTEETHLHPKRKARHRTHQEAENHTPPPVPPPQHMEKPTNPYELYIDIRKMVRGLKIEYIQKLLLLKHVIYCVCSHPSKLVKY